MNYNEIENHDDFYSLSKSADDATSSGCKSAITSALTLDPSCANAIPYVQDYRGYFIVYDVALSDLEKLNEELTLLASHYVVKDTG